MKTLKSLSVFLFGSGFFFLTSVQMKAQELRPVSQEVRNKMVQQITASASDIRSISCDFEQVKSLTLLEDRLVSEGKMYYKPDRLCWEYLRPYKYSFIMNGSKVTLVSETRTDVIDAGSNRLFQEITKVIMGSLTGDFFAENPLFEVQLFEKGKLWVACLTPTDRDMRQIFEKISLFYDPDSSVVKHIEMEESSGDKTMIELKNVRLNAQIDEKIFTVN